MARKGKGVLAKITDAPGAWPSGTRIRKVASDPGDAHQDGSMGTVLGSLGPQPEYQGHKDVYGYCIEWDDLPGVPIWITSYRIERAEVDG